MPTVSVNKEELFKKLGRSYTDEAFDELGFQFGIELDDIVDDPIKGLTYKIEVGANRYDLLCVEGISRALNVYLGKGRLPQYRLLDPLYPDQYRLIVKPSTSRVRPFVVGAVLRNITFNQKIYDSFIDLQDKLHQNIARKRTLVAIGTHDLDTIQGPFIYDAKPPKDISFVPLNESKEYRSDALLEHFSHDSHLKDYVSIIKDKPVYPVIYDSNGIVLSLPPIINGDHSKITLNTKNVFIECTATDQFKAQIVLDTLICMFSEYCEKPFTVESVQVEYSNGEKIQYPKLQYRSQEVCVDYCNSLVGVKESGESIVEKLNLMCLPSKLINAKTIEVEVPPSRYDILHKCDVAEDFAIAYGFDKLNQDRSIPETNTIGQEFEINYYSDKLRNLLAQNSYTEAATFSLCSTADIGSKILMDPESQAYVKVGNPKTIDCEVVRTTLLPGILRTVAANKHISLPLKLFEISDIALRENDLELSRGTGAKNQRNLCAINYNVKAGIETIQGLLDNIMIALKIPFAEDESSNGYYFEGKDHPTFFPGYCGNIIVNGKEVGKVGVVHPQVLLNYNLNNPAAAMEINLEKLLLLSPIK